MGNVEYAECYAELANAIVLQAFKDYRKVLTPTGAGVTSLW